MRGTKTSDWDSGFPTAFVHARLSRVVARHASRGTDAQTASEARRGYSRRPWHHPGRCAHTPWASHRFQFFNGNKPLRSAEKCEETEANAIGTAYVRADLLPAADATKLRALLREYLDQRVLFYTAREEQQLRRVNDRTAQLQTGLWSTVLAPAVSQPTAVVAMAVSGINDVLNAQGYAQAAWSNRIPLAAWSLMAAIAICCSALVGYGARNIKAESMLLPILPFIVSVSFFLIADMDSPRAGVIRVSPHNLATLVESMHVP